MNQGEIVEVRFCESISKIEIVFRNIENKFSFRYVSVVNLEDAGEVALANGYTGDLRIVEQKDLHKVPAQ